MPLAFESLSHGTVAFGFFQIESDMLLLDDLFFFAEDFCAAVVRLAGPGAEVSAAVEIAGWRITGPERVGNLHGAIAGVDHSGFIGATYERWPFPTRPEDFKQNPDGHQTRAWMRDQIVLYGAPETIPVVADPGRGGVAFGEYAFDGREFARLIAYVERGGHPCWREEVRPAYVGAMMRALGAAAP